MEQVYRNMIFHQPSNFVARQRLALMYLKQNRIIEACELLRWYDSYFGGRHTFHQTKIDYCGKE